jgi:hypothetical protein
VQGGQGTGIERYYHLVVNPVTAKGIAKSAQNGVVDALDIYESFYHVQRQSSWAGREQRIHFSKFEPDQITEDDNDDIPQLPASCTCKWCCKWTIREHTALLAYVFSPEYPVPEVLVAETPALRKKTKSIRGTAGIKRKSVMKEIAQQRKQSTNRLAYMDPPVHLQPGAESVHWYHLRLY